VPLRTIDWNLAIVTLDVEASSDTAAVEVQRSYSLSNDGITWDAPVALADAGWVSALGLSYGATYTAGPAQQGVHPVRGHDEPEGRWLRPRAGPAGLHSHPRPALKEAPMRILHPELDDGLQQEVDLRELRARAPAPYNTTQVKDVRFGALARGGHVAVHVPSGVPDVRRTASRGAR
jgi:hypothetical protein